MIAIPVKIYWSDSICETVMEYDIHGKCIYISDDLSSTHGSICTYHNGYIIGDDYRDIRGVTVFCTVGVLYEFVATGNRQVEIHFIRDSIIYNL
jgi:hypothetical protein